MTRRPALAWLATLTVMSVLLPPAAWALEDTAFAALSKEEQVIHRELRDFQAAIQDAFNKAGTSGAEKDLAPILDLVHPDFLLTAMNGQSVRGKAGVTEYFRRHMTDRGHAIARISHTFEADHLSVLLKPDVAMNRGTSLGTYVFTNGDEFEVATRWTATMARVDGRWTVAAFQFGPSIFDNPVMDAAVGWIYKAAALAGGVGLLLGFGIGRFTGRKRAT